VFRRAWLSGLALLLLLLAACLTPGAPSVVVDTAKGASLPTRIKHGLFVTTARIDGVEHGPFVVDSGAFALTLDTRFAESLRLRLFDRRRDSEIQQSVGFATVASLDVGPIAFRNARVSVVDLSAPAAAFGERLAGVLGYPLFAAAVVEVDYPRRAVRCFDPTSYRLPRGAWQPLVLRQWHAGVAVRLDGNIEGAFMLDTGSNQRLHFYAPFVERHRLLEIRDVGKGKVVRITGEHDMLTGRVSWLELGGRRFERPQVSFDPPQTPPRGAGQLFDGVIGYGLLRDFVVVFNYPGGKIAFLDR
jgi:aspartyl protease